MLCEAYHNANGYTGSSVNWYDGTSGSWHQLWIDNGGLILELSGGLDPEGRMVLSGDRMDAQGTVIRDRITWVSNADGTVTQIWDVSNDDGQSWTNSFTGIYRPLR